MPEQVHAKFIVQSGSQIHGTTKQVRLLAVTGSTAENHRFWKATPSGVIEMSIDNPEAHEFFEPGKSYYVTFEEAPDA